MSKRLSLLVGVFFFSLIFCLTFAHSAFSADAGVQFDSFMKSLSGFSDCTYKLSVQNRIRGKMQKKEVILVKSQKGGALYLKWIGKRFKDRELIYKPGWNGGKAWVKPGGPLSCAAVSIGIDDDYLKKLYLRPIVFLALENLFKELGKWKNEGEASVNENTMTIERGSDGKVEIGFSSDGKLKKLVMKSSSGKINEIYEISDFKLNTGLSAADFSVNNNQYGFPGYSENGIFIDPERLKKQLSASWNRVQDYTCTLTKRERIKGKLQPFHTMNVKFRKPSDIYAKWIKETKKGREILYKHDTDGKVLVKESGILGIKPLRIALDSSLLKMDSTHAVTELDIGYALNVMFESLHKGIKNNEVDIRFMGVKFIAGYMTYGIESTSPKDKDYYAPRAILYLDVRTGLPVKIVNYDANDQIFEQFLWSDFKTNVGLTDEDFNEENPAYKF